MVTMNAEQVVSMDCESMDESYTHFNFYKKSTKISLEALSNSEHETVLEMISWYTSVLGGSVVGIRMTFNIL